MKKIIFFLLMFLSSNIVYADFECISDSDCAEAMTCAMELCRMTAGKFSDYAQVEVKLGEKSPSAGISRNIFITHPAKDLVLGQFNISVSQNGAEGKYFVFREMDAVIAVSNQKIKASNLRLIYDVNGDGKFDGSDIVVSSIPDPEKNQLKFVLDQKKVTYRMNQDNNFIVTGDFEFDGEIEMLWPFGLEFTPSSDLKISNAGDVFIISHQKTSFAKYIFEPQKGYFIATAGEHFPSPPDWKNMNRENNIMHLRLKSVDGQNEVTSITLRTVGSSIKMGEGVKSVSVFTDNNRNGSGDDLLVKKTFLEGEELSAVVINFPSGSLVLGEGEEKMLVIKADLFLYNKQTVQFMINDNDIGLKNRMSFAGLPVTTDVYRYSCDEEDPLCNVIQEDSVEEEESDGGCSILVL
jgi:hypothetical protein